jgi:hypothetical protein
VVPLRVISDTAWIVRQSINGDELDPNLVLLTYRCSSCAHVVEIRLADLALTSMTS